MDRQSTSGHVYLSRRLTERAMERLVDLDTPVRVNPDPDQPPTRSELLAEAVGARGLITLLTENIDAEVLDAAGSELEIIANVAVGYDNIDLTSATERGVVVTNTPGVLNEATADLTVGLILAVSRRIVEADRFLRDGHAWTWGPNLFTGLDLSAGTVLGIVGLGRIGMAVARRCHAFGMDICAVGSHVDSEEAQALGVKATDLDALLEVSDVVTLHCPLTPETRHLIGATQLEQMKPTAILVNTARGPVVDESALVEALRHGQIGGAGLDVFEEEPSLHPGLVDLPNTVLQPHIASAGRATRDRMGELAIGNVAAVLAGKDALTPVTA
jgi:lactate dehydrogenase-like 2-hydroxyacid dehydrogenase